VLEEGEQRDTGDLCNLEANSWNITDGVTLTTETRHQDFIVIIAKSQTTIARNEGSDLLAVLDQLHTDALTNSRVRLLGLNTDFFRHDTLGVRSSLNKQADQHCIKKIKQKAMIKKKENPYSEGIVLERSAESTLVVLLVSPSVVTVAHAQLTGSLNSSRFTDTHLPLLM
jgi:hypothetical protein